MNSKRRLALATALKMILSLCILSSVFSISARPARPGAARVSTNAFQSGDQYLVEFKGNHLPDDLSARVTALGGTVIDVFPEIKVAFVGDLTKAAAGVLAAQPDVADVTNDEFVSVIEPFSSRPVGSYQIAPMPMSIANPEAAAFFPYQWNMRVIGADRAWQEGYMGSSQVRIAIIDTGIDPTHPDLAGLIDASISASFAPEDNWIVAQEFPSYPLWTDLVGHGTFVASIASSEGNLVAGVNSRAALMAVKACSLPGICRLTNILRSMYFAANNGADVINMSLGNAWAKSGTRGYHHYLQLYAQYAVQKGVSAVVVAAGNSAADLDSNGNEYALLCDTPAVMCVSATGPTTNGPNGLGPFLNIDAPAFYTNFGASAIDVAAPGGNLSFDSSGNIIGWGLVPGACASTDRAFDSSGNLVPGVCSSGGYTVGFGAGTSVSAPHVSGLAALLVSRLGHGSSAQVRTAIENSADDLGKPGVDPFYGRGRINVARALGLP